jgi:hypothetical protein
MPQAEVATGIAPFKNDVKIGRGPHFMFRAESRFELYRQTAFCLEGR